MKPYSLIALAAIAIAGCTSGTSASAGADKPQQASALVFDADSAYAFTAAQTAFGPRVPGSEASERCGSWLAGKLRQMGAANIQEQRAQATAYNGTPLRIRNITAQFNPQDDNRVLLLAHWDSRPWADQEADAALRDQPIDGANDGASGVAVILEVARNLAANGITRGVDVLFTDAEDYGRRADDDSPLSASDNSWCLGTQHWVKNPTLDLGAVRYAVLLDMVGGRDAVFHREMHSEYLCKDLNDKMWQAARDAGQQARFANELGGAIVDDHIYLIQAGIPAIDIIESANAETGSFSPTWHTHADNISNIDPQTLKAAGIAVTNFLKQN